MTLAEYIVKRNAVGNKSTNAVVFDIVSDLCTANHSEFAEMIAPTLSVFLGNVTPDDEVGSCLEKADDHVSLCVTARGRTLNITVEPNDLKER